MCVECMIGGSCYLRIVRDERAIGLCRVPAVEVMTFSLGCGQSTVDTVIGYGDAIRADSTAICVEACGILVSLPLCVQSVI